MKKRWIVLLSIWRRPVRQTTKTYRWGCLKIEGRITQHLRIYHHFVQEKTKLEGILVVWTHPFPAHTVGIMLQSQVWRSFTNQTISNNIRAPTREYANKVVSKALAKLVVIPNIHLSLLVIAISWKCLYTNIRIQWDQFDIFHQKLNMSMGSFFREMEVSNPWGYPISSAILIGIFHYPLVI